MAHLCSQRGQHFHQQLSYALDLMLWFEGRGIIFFFFLFFFSPGVFLQSSRVKELFTITSITMVPIAFRAVNAKGFSDLVSQSR